MRVLMTTDTVGGVWSFTASLCASLCGGNEVSLVSFGGQPSAAQDSWVRGMRTVQDGFFEFHASPAPLEWQPGNVRTLEGAELLDEVATDFKPDLLHTSQFCWGALPRTGALAVPRVVTAHSDVLSWAAACRPEGLEDSPWLGQYRQLVQLGLDGADLVTAPTQWMLDALQLHFTLPASAPRGVIPNGVSSSASKPEKGTVVPPRTLQAFTAGRFWDEGKNLALLQQIDFPFPVFVAGELGSTAPPTSGQLRFMGQLSPEELRYRFRQSALYLCPSVYEPFGLAPLEAAACGCALLLNDLPSLREIWGDAALYFHDARSLQSLVTSLAQSPETIAEAAARAIARASEFSLTRTARAYTAAYNQAAGSQQKDHPAHAW